MLVVPACRGNAEPRASVAAPPTAPVAPPVDAAIADVPAHELEEATIADLQAKLASRAETSQSLVTKSGSSSGSAVAAAVANLCAAALGTVPMGSTFGLPLGLSFFGKPWREGKLLGYAYAYAQATKHRRPPRYLPTAKLSS